MRRFEPGDLVRMELGYNLWLKPWGERSGELKLTTTVELSTFVNPDVVMTVIDEQLVTSRDMYEVCVMLPSGQVAWTWWGDLVEVKP